MENLRIGLNRAYSVVETRHWILLRLELIGYVLVAAVASLALGFLVVLGPLMFRTALAYAPWLEPLEGKFTFFRFAIAAWCSSSRCSSRINGCRPAAAE